MPNFLKEISPDGTAKQKIFRKSRTDFGTDYAPTMH